MNIASKQSTKTNEYIPVVGSCRNGPPKDFVGSGYPVNYGNYCCKIPREGDLYGLRLDQDLLGWAKGDVIILDPARKTLNLKVGSAAHKEVLLRKFHESEAKIFRLTKFTNESWEETWEAENLSSPGSTEHISVHDIEILHPIVGIVFTDMVVERLS